VTISLIAAVASNGVIGRGGKLPWKLPGDLPRFKVLTMGRALPGRTNLVLSRDPGLRIEGCTVVHSVEDARRAAAATGTAEAFVIGGAEVYAAFLPEASRMYLTHVDSAVAGDATFPRVDWGEWRATDEEPGSTEALPHRFVHYERT